MFSDKLIAIRKEKGLTQTELAKLLHISRSTVSMYELGEREPNFKQLNEISKALNVSIADLIDNNRNAASLAAAAQRRQAEAELQEYLELLRTRPEMKVLLDTVKDATKEEVEANVQFIEALRKSRQD
jgi:transcriptional regulator with XRE-family HTH domain